jgi:peptide/nickel transport system permease protein
MGTTKEAEVMARGNALETPIADLRSSARSQSQFQIALRNLFKNKGAVVGLVLVGLMALTAFAAPVLTPYEPLKLNITERLVGPSMKHLIGTDHLGRDVLTRVLYGGRLSLVLGFFSVSVGLGFGIVVGLVAGFQGGKLDNLLMRLVDMMMAMPSILLALVIAFALGPSLTNLMIAVGVGIAPTYARVTRGSVMSTKNELYVEAARVLGCSNLTIMLRHVLPNVIAPVVVLSTLSMGTAILSAATLSFLGMGVQPPTPEWGNMVSEGRDRLVVAPWVTFGPGLAIMISVLGMNLLGDGLRDALDPKLRGR